MSIVEFSCLFCNTKRSEFFDMAKFWAARLCRLPKQELFVAQDIIKVKIYSVAELSVFYIGLPNKCRIFVNGNKNVNEYITSTK